MLRALPAVPLRVNSGSVLEQFLIDAHAVGVFKLDRKEGRLSLIGQAALFFMQTTHKSPQVKYYVDRGDNCEISAA